MTTNTLINVRGDEVLRLLATHEALSFGALRSLTEPPITEKKLRLALSRLSKKQIITRRRFDQFGGTAMFYEIAEPFRSDLNLGKVHSSMLMHNDVCALTVETLRRVFRHTSFVTEFKIPKDPSLVHVMKYQKGVRDSLPDILMVIPDKTAQRSTFIAFEIERFTKSTKRLMRKLRRYGAGTLLDGVVYLAPERNILRVVADRYKLVVAEKAARIRHYKEHFLVTAGHPTKQMLGFKDPQNALGEAISLIDWIHRLSSTSMSERSDRAFLAGGGARPSKRRGA